MIWRILGIEETKDKKEITRAYRMMLTSVNPEDKPEEFKQLRAAYEEAMKLADMEDAPEAEKTPVDLWVDRLNSLYMDLDQRRSLEAWEFLMSDPLCVSLDSKPLILDAMLQYMLEHYRLPQQVWQYLNEIFALTDITEDLYSSYPQNFVNYVILDGIRYPDNLPYDMFPMGTDGEECDEYIATFFSSRQGSLGECAEDIEKLRNMSLHHPYGDAQVARYDAFNGDENAPDRIAMLMEAYPNDINLKLDFASACQYASRFEEALTHASEIVELIPDHQHALRIMAHAYAGLEDFKNAVDAINRLMDLMGGNRNLMYELISVREAWNDALIEQYIGKLEADPDDYVAAYDLAWSYLQNDKLEAAFDLLPKLKAGYPTDFKYSRLVFLLNCAVGNNEEALQAADALIAIGMGGEYDENETDAKRESYLSDAYARKMHLLIDLGRADEAIDVMNEATGRFPDDADLYTNSCYACLHMKRYDEALACAEKIMEIMPDSAHGYSLAANACFNMNRDNEAFSLLNTALDYDGSDLSSYLLKLRILVRNRAYEPAQDLINFLHENGITDEPTTIWCEAQIIQRTTDDKDGAYAKFQEADRIMAELDAVAPWAPEFYYSMACLLGEIKDAKKDYTPDDLLEILNKGIAADPDDFDCLEYKGWLLKRDEHNDEALEIYHKLEKYPRTNRYIEKQLAELYYDDSMNYADRSLHYYNMIAEDEDESRIFHLDVSYLNYLMKDFDKAISEINRVLELNPNDSWAYFRLAQIHIVTRRFEQAYEYACKALELHREAVADSENRRRVYWTTVAQVLRLMNRPAEAVAMYAECAREVSSYIRYYEDAFETLMTAGMHDEIDKLMSEWAREQDSIIEWSGHQALYLMLQGKYEDADQVLRKYADAMSQYHYDLVSSAVSANLRDFTETVSRRQGSLGKQIEAGKDNLCYEYSALAMAQWYNGDYEAANANAVLALEAYDKYQKQFDMYTPVYIGSASVAMAIAGRIDEARELASKMNECPLCAMCTYHTCKDMYMYSAEIEIIAGNYAKAREFMRLCREADPGEESIAFCEAYLRTKGELH